jgi:hypothetical protein
VAGAGRSAAGASAGGSGGAAQAGAAGTGARANTKSDACIAYATAVCERREECRGTTVGDCYMYTRLCPDLTFSPGSTRTVDGLYACADQYRQEACDAVNLDVIPPCVTPGTREAGATCVASSQCTSLVCDTNGGGCGTCEPMVGVGESCSGSVTCTPGLYCDPATQLCATYEPVMQGGAGDPCSTDSDCGGWVFCDQTTTPRGTCTPYPEVGADCSKARGCASDGYCALTDLVCHALPGTGQACGVDARSQVPHWCASPLVCHPATDSAPATCLPGQARGEPCLVDASGATDVDSCAPGLTCDNSLLPATCMGGALPGESCNPSAANPCAPGYSCPCADSSCTSGTCVTLSVAGGRCDEPNTQCHPAFTCTGGVCAPIDSQGLFAACGTP